MTDNTTVPIRPNNILLNVLTARSLRPVRHLILLAAITAIAISQNMSYYPLTGDMSIRAVYLLALITAAAYMAVAYIHIYILVTGYLVKKNYGAYFLSSVALIILLAYVRIGQNHLAEGLWDARVRPFGMAAIFDSLSDMALNLLCFTGVSVTVLLRYWMKEEKRISELESGRLAAQIGTVRNSVDPEILLGTIRKCGEQAVTQPERSSEMILQLSEILRYQLYESVKEKIFLDAEIKFIRNYLELEKQRTGDFDYTVDVEGNTLVYTVPLVFMPAVKTAVAGLKKGERLSVVITASPGGVAFRSDSPSDIACPGDFEYLYQGYGDRIDYGVSESGGFYITIRDE